MVLFITKKFYCCLFVFASFAANAQTAFTASLMPAQSARDEYITLKLTVANASDVRNITPPSLADFIVVSGPHTETEMINANGLTKQFISLSYVLLPKRPGAYTVGPATALVNGRVYRSKPVSGLVTNKKIRGRPNDPYTAMQMSPSGFDQAEEPNPTEQFDDYILHKGESVPQKVNRNMQLRLQTDKTSCYIGEPILASYKLYTRLRSESNLSKNPSFNGFSVVDMTAEDPMNFKRETLQGREYNVYTIRKAQLYPLQAGKIELETATLDNKIEFLRAKGSSNAYNSDPGAIISEHVSLSTHPFSIHVKPLPEEGKPTGFNGAVGNFRIQSSLERKSFSAQETGKLLLTISGKGNMHLLTAPEIKWPAGFENFDAKCIDNTDNSTIPLSGNKTFEIPFSVSVPGKYHTPEITLSYFDPGAGMYKTITAAALEFDITPASRKHPAAVYAGNSKTEPTLLNRLVTNRWLIILLLAGIIISGIILFLSRDKKATAVAVTSRETPEPASELSPALFPDHDPLMKSEACLQNEGCTEFYTILNVELRQFLTDKFAPGAGFLTSKTLAAAMDRAGIDNDAILRTQQLLREIEFELYTPFEQNEKAHRLYAGSQTLVQIINMQKTNL